MSPVIEGPRSNVIHRGDVVVVAGRGSTPAAVTSTPAAARFLRWE
jgi:hypothetical protein